MPSKRLKCLNICSPAWKIVEPLGDDEAELEEVWGLIVIAHVGVSRALTPGPSTRLLLPQLLNALAALATVPLLTS